MVAIADQLLDVAGDECRGLGVVKPHTARQSPLGQEAQLRDGELVQLESVTHQPEAHISYSAAFEVGCVVRVWLVQACVTNLSRD